MVSPASHPPATPSLRIRGAAPAVHPAHFVRLCPPASRNLHVPAGPDPRQNRARHVDCRKIGVPVQLPPWPAWQAGVKGSGARPGARSRNAGGNPPQARPCAGRRRLKHQKPKAAPLRNCRDHSPAAMSPAWAPAPRPRRLTGVPVRRAGRAAPPPTSMPAAPRLD